MYSNIQLNQAKVFHSSHPKVYILFPCLPENEERGYKAWIRFSPSGRDLLHFCNAVCSCQPQTGSPICPQTAGPSFWQMRATTCGWGTAGGTLGPGATYISPETPWNSGLSGKEKGQGKMDKKNKIEFKKHGYLCLPVPIQSHFNTLHSQEGRSKSFLF